MSISSLLSSIFILVIGISLFYWNLPKTKQSNSNKLPDSFGSVFMLLGIGGILTFCLGIDGGNYTPEKQDDMNFLNGGIVLICAFSLEYHVQFLLQKIKQYRINFKKQKLTQSE